MRDLTRYRAMRDFGRTSEPAAGAGGPTGAALRYAMQKHDASRLHWDLRLEHDGALLSWAVTRGPSLDPADKRLAVRTEDHPLDYLRYEGIIAKGNYGAGTVMLWDIGWWQPLHDVDEGLDQGHLHFALHGERATGGWSLIRMKGKKPADAKRENWLLVKENDTAARACALVETYRTSVATGRTIAQIADKARDQPMWPARRKTRPRFTPPQLAEPRAAPPEGEDWWHEVKLDGYRTQVALGKGGARIHTRGGHDWTDRFAPLLPPLNRLPADSALIDGEIVGGAGQDRFGDISVAIKQGGPFVFYAFDLLELDGRDLRAAPLHDRRAALEDLLAQVVPRGAVQLSPVVEGDPAEAFRQVTEAGGEGLVSKLRSAPYRSGRSSAWVKTKADRRGAFAIVGWQHSTARGRTIASLLLASHDNGTLTYRGKVGSGFDPDGEDLLARLTALARKDCPLASPPRLDGRVTWVTPGLIAEVRFAEITRSGHLRHARFVALREDKAPPEVTLDGMQDRLPVAGIGISHPDRRVYTDPPVTKGEIARYYEAVADRLLAEARNRPLSLLRLPDGLSGQSFFQKNRGKGFPDALQETEFTDAGGATQSRMYLANAGSLLAAVQMGTVELHIEGVRLDRPARPDRMILDLDPDEGLGFAAVRDAAFLIRDLLAAAGLPSWAMVTGGKGVHVVAPLRRVAETASVTLFARLVASMLAEAQPERFTQRMAKADRSGRIFIDWLRNEVGATAVAPFSLRARPGAAVAIPVGWDELGLLDRADGFSMADALGRDWAMAGVPKPGTISSATAKRLSRALRDI